MDKNQLIREDNELLNKTYLYTYDNAGNILTKSVCPLTAENVTPTTTTTHNYAYNNSSWGDQLTSYKGQSIVYDAIGNPTTYYNGTQYTNMTWEQGRNLTFLMMGTSYVSFEYNDQGIRTSKTLSNGTTYNYILDGTRIVAETWSNELLIYLYDDNGSPIGMQSRYSGYAENEFDTYWFEKNLQGDIIAVYNENGVKLVAYTYDAWGNFTTTYCNGGENDYALDFNPFRYRGYYYDEETGFYYLNSRYYDPVTGRFINADGELSGIGGDIRGNNLYAYCYNNPVMYTDPMGNWPNWDLLVQGALLVVIGVGVAAATVMTAGTAGVCVAGAIAASAVFTASVTTAAFGASDIVESFTGTNYMDEALGEENSAMLRMAAITVTSMGMSYMANGGNFAVCFVEGTLIKTDQGNVPIEDVTIGTLVYAHNPDTGETALKEVLNTFVREETDKLIHIEVNGEKITTTPTHPFWVPQKGWTKAVELRAGDRLQLLNGEYVIVEQIQHEILESPVTVYNFEVEDFHTYYVTDSAILVHNYCGEKGIGGKGWVGDKTWRENVSTVGKGGTITSLNGGIPSKAQAMQLINQSGGTALRIEGAHQFPNPHNYSHINYVTSTGIKGTIKIFE